MSIEQSSKSVKDIKMGFKAETILLTIDEISPLKLVTPVICDSGKFKQILSSIREIGVIEPPVVAAPHKGQNKYFLLDGHLRIEALKKLGIRQVTCLISTDDESFTYNKHINRLSTIQEHRMIVRAIKRGVPEEKIALALNIKVKNIIRKRNLLNGICPEAVDLLKDKAVAAQGFSILRQMKPMRQIEAATLMRDANIYSLSYLRVLLAATPKDQLAESSRSKRIRGLSDNHMPRMELELGNLHGQYRLLEESFGPNVLTLTVAKTYLSKLLNNGRIVKYLTQHYPEYLTEFQKITEMNSLGGSAIVPSAEQQSVSLI